MNLRVRIPCLIAFALMFSPARGQTVSATTSPVGAVSLGAYNTTTSAYIGLLANSDTLISLPMTRPPVFVGTTSGAPTGSTIPISGSPNWTSNQFVYASGSQTNTYYVLIGANSTTTNPKEGCLYTITGNDASDLTINPAGDTTASIDTIPAGTQVTIIPFWTLGTIFPAANANISFTPSVSTRALETSILIPNASGTGINLGNTSDTFYYVNGNWLDFNDPTNSPHNDFCIPPNSYFIVRNNNGAPTLPLVLTGNVVMGKISLPLVTQASAYQDNLVSITRPCGVTLANCGLNTGDGSFVASTETRDLQDQVLLFDNSTPGFNKSAPATYYYLGGQWMLYSDSQNGNHDNDPIPAGAAIIIRKAPTGTDNSVFWTNTASYSQ